MKVGIAQTDCILGDLSANLKKHIELAQKAEKEGVEVLFFPELSLTGYLLEDRVKEIAIFNYELTELFINSSIKNCTLIVGYAEKDNNGHIFNSQAVIEVSDNSARLLSNTRKINLPTYGMFDEARHYNSGDSVEKFLLGSQNVPASILICEDMWHPTLPIALSIDPNTVPSILIAPAASPSRGYSSEVPSNLDGWEKNISFFATALGMYVINPQRVGVEDSFIFAGGSMLASPDGSIIKAHLFEEQLLIADLDISEISAKRQKTKIISSKDISILRNLLL